MEATIRQDERSFAEMEAFAHILSDYVNSVSSSHHVTIDVSQPCPKEEFIPDIVSFIKAQIALFDDCKVEQNKFLWERTAHTTHYKLSLTIYRHSGPNQPLEVIPSWGGMSELDKYLYNSIDTKAHKYGDPDLPFVIAVWGLQIPDEATELSALYGRDTISWLRDSRGDVVPDSTRIGRQHNGVFTLIENNQRRNKQISAVVFYQHHLSHTNHTHSIRIYHNPYAMHPLSTEVFLDNPQFIPIGKNNRGEMKWLNPPSQ